MWQMALAIVLAAARGLAVPALSGRSETAAGNSPSNNAVVAGFNPLMVDCNRRLNLPEFVLCTLVAPPLRTDLQESTNMEPPLRRVLSPLVLKGDTMSPEQKEQVKQTAQRDDVLQVAQEAVKASESPADKTALVPPPVPKKQLGGDGQSGPVTVSAQDVNGDGKNDAVVLHEGTGARAVLLNDGQGQLQKQAVSLNQPGHEELDRLAVAGQRNDKPFLAADLNGDGKRQLAVKQGDTWLSLGTADDSDPARAGAPTSAAEEAEDRYEAVLGELSWIVPALAWSEDFDADPDGGGVHGAGSAPQRGFVQMISGNVEYSWLKGSDMNASDLGDMVMIDSLGSNVGAFDPFGVGMRIFGAAPPGGGPKKH
jgi:FG-GAP-like repeat